jgi:universal stress protein E
MSANSWKSIVVAVRDPDAKMQMAVKKASELARRCNARLTLLHVFAFPYPIPKGTDLSSTDILDRVQSRWEKSLARLAAPLIKTGLKVDCVVQWDYPIHDAIVRHIQKAKPDLLVAESHHHGMVARWFLTNTDWELIRSCPCPLWFVKTAHLPEHPAILAAVDPFHARAKPANLDGQIIDVARQLKKRISGKITVAHACEIPMTAIVAGPMEALPIPLSSQEVRKLEREAKRVLSRLVKKHGLQPSDCAVQVGSPNVVIESLVKKQKIDVLVMGAVSRRGLNRALIGSTAERIIDPLQCDALILKPKGFKATVGRSITLAA